jgi:hypothetical protein
MKITEYDINTDAGRGEIKQRYVQAYNRARGQLAASADAASYTHNRFVLEMSPAVCAIMLTVFAGDNALKNGWVTFQPNPEVPDDKMAFDFKPMDWNPSKEKKAE